MMSHDKHKASAKEHATQHANDVQQGASASEPASLPTSEKERSQGRFPGETPLTGEDRPADKAGGKKEGQGTAGAGQRRPG
jgi:hypothetical protein